MTLLCFPGTAAFCRSSVAFSGEGNSVTKGTVGPYDTYRGRMQACLLKDGVLVVETDGKGNPLLGTAYLLSHHLSHVRGTTAESLERALAAISKFLPLSDASQESLCRPICVLDGKALDDIGLLSRNRRITALTIRTQPEVSFPAIEFLTGKKGRAEARAALKEADAQDAGIFQYSTSGLTLKRLKDRLDSQSQPAAAGTKPEKSPAIPTAKPASLSRAAEKLPEAAEPEKPAIVFMNATTVHSSDGRITVKDTGHGFRIETRGTKPAVVVNGKPVSDSCLLDMNPSEISGLRLLLEPEAAMEKYGEAGRKGIIEIELRNARRAE